MRLIIGLGNPGRRYARTRHNIGFMAVDAYADKWNIKFKSSKFNAEIGEYTGHGQKIILLKPQTYMNLAGHAVRACMDFHKIEPDEMIVLYDDLDTPFGQIRLRYKGGAGGHNGVHSLIQQIGSEQWKRIRIGISRPEQPMDIADYVLSRFTRDEEGRLRAVVEMTVEALEAALEQPFEKVMAEFNGRTLPPGG